jgi:hypothetical protein
VFKGELEEFRENNFNFIFAVDQFNSIRFLPTYIETFNLDYCPPKNDECKASFTKDELRTVLTAKDIFSFVNNVPFIEEYKKSNLIASPDFTMTQNKGTLIDHVIVLCCLMMGCNYETMDEVGKMKELIKKYGKEMVPLENRIFVCVGSNKYSRKRELWLMNFNRDLDTVVMWDVKNGISYELAGRISKERKEIQKMYLIVDPAKDAGNKGEGSMMDLLQKCRLSVTESSRSGERRTRKRRGKVLATPTTTTTNRSISTSRSS